MLTFDSLSSFLAVALKQGAHTLKHDDEKKTICMYLIKRIWLFLSALASRIEIGQGISVGPGKLGKKNKSRALDTHVLCSK